MNNSAAPDSNVYTRSAIWRMFRDAADEDYLVSRIAARAHLPYQFLWSSQQAIEKYLKAIVLLNGKPIPTKGHKLVDLYGIAAEICDDLIPYIIVPPNEFPTDNQSSLRRHFEPTSDYIQRLEDDGDPSNRYRTFSIMFDYSDLHKLDQMSFLLRRAAFPLDMEVSKSRQTARQMLRNSRTLQLHGEMGFEKNIHRRGKDYIAENFRWINFSFFPERVAEDDVFMSGVQCINSEISLAISSFENEERVGAMGWIAANALPKNLKKEVLERLQSTRAVSPPSS